MKSSKPIRRRLYVGSNCLFCFTVCSCDSVESFPGSRNNSRAAERDWDNGSTASSITSMAEYTG